MSCGDNTFRVSKRCWVRVVDVGFVEALHEGLCKGLEKKVERSTCLRRGADSVVAWRGGIRKDGGSHLAGEERA